ncbi:4Fe-4S dicluster domain-containing protein [Anaerovirgula multivorans]|uniref:4Fe-4S dicluster domain-containing protein n=1 Tax=Anaerovirgula multivorans TaxID=312168 RepID=A0A239AU11_9FIRM|nr:4Fe-4S dicluster domain-containing protein [Anaerovirgula multivorans]SNR98831.1 4Fe-4S dicluster domain-containing protein [Anaerovirgula multivorans]
MSKNWYPVIEYLKCDECGACVKKCSHGVYNKKKDITPLVVHPEGCVDGCHGCGNICPNGAIQYVGENTDWTPPNGSISAKKGCGCGGGC